MVRPQQAILAAVSAGMVMMALAVSCGDGTPTQGSPQVQAVDAREVLREAVAEVLRLESAAFVLEHLTGTTTLFPGLEMSKAFGVVDIPDKFRITVEAESAFPRSFVEIKVVTIGDKAYMTDVITGQWREVSLGVLPIDLSNLGQTLADIIEAVEAPSHINDELLKGVDSHHIRGRIQSQELAGLVPGAGQGFDVQLDLWLEQSRSLLLQVLITGKVVPTDSQDTVRLLTLDDINLPVEITAPR